MFLAAAGVCGVTSMYARTSVLPRGGLPVSERVGGGAGAIELSRHRAPDTSAAEPRSTSVSAA